MSGVGQTNGYTLINCSGFSNEFNPETEVKSEGEMPANAKEFTVFLEDLLVNY